MTDIRLNADEIKSLHCIQLEMLLEFDRVCKALQLHYHLAAGSLLGAVRHGGFIPWDDDIDVAMPRHDYQRLLTEAPKMFAKEFFLQNWRSDPEFSASFSKLRRNGSEFREVSVQKLAIHHGIYIDIFPFDFVAPERWWGRFHLGCVRFFQLLNALACFRAGGKISSNRPVWQNALGRLGHFALMPIPKFWRLLAYDKLIALLQNVCKDHVTCLATMPLDKARADVLIRDASELQETILLRFEAHMFPAPSAFNAVLTRLYGEYMKLPPQKKRFPTHAISVLNIPEHPDG